MFVLLIARQLRKVDVLDLKPLVNYTGLMTVVAPSDRPKSVRNRCVIESYCSVFI